LYQYYLLQKVPKSQLTPSPTEKRRKRWKNAHTTDQSGVCFSYVHEKSPGEDGIRDKWHYLEKKTGKSSPVVAKETRKTNGSRIEMSTVRKQKRTEKDMNENPNWAEEVDPEVSDQNTVKKTKRGSSGANRCSQVGR
jgi:hypothetical protein